MAFRLEAQAEPIPGYKLIERLGGGGFGEVWKAEAPGGLHKAIKFVYGDLESVDPDGDRAGQELKALSRVKTVRHPFVLSLERYDIINGQLMIVMELADRNLWERFRECWNQGLPGIPRVELLRYLTEAAEALDLMNQQYDLQHLDIKPQNLFLVHNHVKVADFGLVKDLEGLAATMTGGVTPVYAAPETFDGWVSRHCDQYSLAIVYQELLTGQRPFTGSNTRQLIMQHLKGEPQLEPAPAADRPILARALAKTPQERFPTCTDLVTALQKADVSSSTLIGPASSTPAGPSAGRAPAVPVRPPQQDSTLESTPFGLAGHISTAEEDAENGTGALEATPPGDLAGAGTLTAVPALQPTRDEERGPGVLLPSLVVGLGHFGLRALQQLRKSAFQHGLDLTRLPHVRLLSLDTVLENLAGDPQSQEMLNLDEILLARLYRASRYVRPRGNLPPLADWINSKLIYRIPRDPATQGIRALGRLAFVDNYGHIVARLRRELERATEQESLDTARETSGQELRSNWPRVYVVTSLSGGTGGGAFLDLAYVVHSLLREMGFGRQEIVGVFFVPGGESRPDSGLALANTYAALVELNHFNVPGELFQARYDSKLPVLRESGPALTHCVLLPLPERGATRVTPDSLALTGEWLYRQLLSPLGRAADTLRTGKAEAGSRGGPSAPLADLGCFGLTVLTSPRRDLIRSAAPRLCRKLTERWTAKNPPERAAEIGAHVRQYLEARGLGPESCRLSLDAACTRALGRPVEACLEEAIAPVGHCSAQEMPTTPLVREVFAAVNGLLGAPEETLRQAPVPVALQDGTEEIVKRTGEALTALIAEYFNQPGGRYSASEEAVRQAVGCVEAWLKEQEAGVQRLREGVRLSAGKLEAALAECERAAGSASRVNTARRATLLTEFLERLSSFVRERYDLLVTERVVGVYLSMRGYLSDQTNDLGFCRKRLQELARTLNDMARHPTAKGASPADIRQTLTLLPQGCATLEQAAERVVDSFREADLNTLDQVIQSAMREQYPTFVELLFVSGDLLKNFPKVMLRETEAILDRRIPRPDVAELFLAQAADERDRIAEIDKAFDQAKPPIPKAESRSLSEIAVVTAPDTDAGRQFLALVEQALPGTHTATAENNEEIVFYREYLRLPPASLEQLGPEARTAYEAACASEHFTPHTRLDISSWKPLAAADLRDNP